MEAQAAIPVDVEAVEVDVVVDVVMVLTITKQIPVPKLNPMHLASTPLLNGPTCLLKNVTRFTRSIARRANKVA